MGISLPQKEASMERVLDKLDEIAKQIQELSVRVARIEPIADQHKDLAAKQAVNEVKLAELDKRIVALETKILVVSSLAAAGGGGLGLALSKMFGG